MIKIDGIEYRNLEEQVLKNKEDIAAHYNIDRVLADFGIRIVGTVDSYADLPDESTYEGEYGYAYAVGTEAPYDFYVWTRPDPNSGHDSAYWFDIGQLAIVGPQGPQGPQGEPGPKGDKGNRGEPGLNGAQGPAGPKGATGATGPKGDQGERGPAGNPAQNVVILGTVDSVSQLPAPGSVARNGAYLVVSDDEYTLYIITGTTNLMWQSVGPFNTATQVSVGGEYVASFDADTKLDKNPRGNYNKWADVYIPIAEQQSDGSFRYSWKRAINRAYDGTNPTPGTFSQYGGKGSPVIRNSDGNIPLPGQEVDNLTTQDVAISVATADYRYQRRYNNYSMDGYITLPAPVVAYAGYLGYPDNYNAESVSDATEEYAGVGPMYLMFLPHNIPMDYESANYFEYLDLILGNVADNTLQLMVEGEACCVQYMGYWYDPDTDTETFRITFNRMGTIINLLYYFYNQDDSNNSAEEFFMTQDTYDFS